jgi:hypothetical protein
MVPKRVRTSSASDFSEVKAKRSKKVMTLTQKAELLDKLKEGPHGWCERVHGAVYP